MAATTNGDTLAYCNVIIAPATRNHDTQIHCPVVPTNREEMDLPE